MLSSFHYEQNRKLLWALFAGLMFASVGCQSMGRLNLLNSKDIPVLTRQADEYPPPSSAATPTSTTPDETATATDNGSAMANMMANSGDQTQNGIEYPTASATNVPNNFAPGTSAKDSLAATATAALGPDATAATSPTAYPTTNYQTFPDQPESAPGQPNQPSSSMANNGNSNYQSPMTSASSGNVQQGLYATQPMTSPPAMAQSSPATPGMATTPQPFGFPNQTANGNSDMTGNWPTPLSNQNVTPSAASPPQFGTLPQAGLVAHATHVEPMASANDSQCRDSEFGSCGTDQPQNMPQAPGALAAQPATAMTASTATNDFGNSSPAASPIQTYIDPTSNSPAVATASHVTASESHYEDMSTASTQNTGGWSPGSTSKLPGRF